MMSKLYYSLFMFLTGCSCIQSRDEGGDKYENLEMEVKSLKETLGMVTRQLMLQQFFTEEKIRSDGFSGIKQIRTSYGGSKNYFSNTYSGEAFAAMHDHANNIRTVGLGEFIAVLNGVEFRTRHNDYRLNQPHSTRKKYHAIEPIKFPDVPPAVLAQPNVTAQIDEMRKWFRAWKESDHTVRDYRKYFHPVLCYLEGAWTRAKRDGSIDEPFESDRHFVDANSWFDLQEQVKFTSYTGTKSLSENLAFLPTTIMSVKKSGAPRFAQWNYRILCHKLKTHVPLTKLRPVEDLSSRMSRHINETEYSQSRAARFELDLDLDSESKRFDERLSKYNFLDKLMEEIPGKDNYPGKLNDGGFDSEIYNMNGKTPKDVSKYHRWFTLRKTDAMGKSDGHRGYADQFLFAAKTTQKRVAGMKVTVCNKDAKRRGVNICRKRKEKWSYAIPLEIIYLTPLTNWNPHSIRIESNCRVDGRVNKDDTRVGKGLCKHMSKAKTYACPQFYYITPDEFFTGNEVNSDPADTAHTNGWCMLDKNKNGVAARATGTRIFFPTIPGIGKLRQRFPIAPVHGEGNPIWKNLNALSDIVLHNGTYDFMKATGQRKLNRAVTFQLTMSKIESKKPPHAHYFTLFESDVTELLNGGTVKVSTGMRQLHYHTLVMRYDRSKQNFYYTRCDDLPLCYDQHPKIIAKIS